MTADATPQRVGILAGGGALPREIAAHLQARNIPVHIVALEGEADAIPPELPQTEVNWGQIGGIVEALRAARATHVVFAGSVRRPDLGRIKPDLGLVKAIPHIIRIVTAGGDDAVLRGCMRFFEEKGLQLMGPAQAAPELLVGPGLLGGAEPTADALADAQIGFELIAALGPFDIGQAVIVHGGKVCAIEGAEGTDRMLERFALARRASGERKTGGLLIKRPKPGQELRIDLPAIGPGTVERASQAGLEGIAVMAGGVIVVERRLMIAQARSHNVFVTGIEVSDNRGKSAGPTDIQADWSKYPLQELGTRVPKRMLREDMRKGQAVIHALKPFTSSQGAVVVRGHVLAVEAGEGINAMLERARGLRQWGDKRWQWRNGALAVAAGGLPDDTALVLAQEAGLAGIATSVQGTQQEHANVRRDQSTRSSRGKLIWAQVVVPAADGADDRHSSSHQAAKIAGARPLRLFLVAGEHSGDVLGGKLMAAIDAERKQPVTYAGVGDRDMAQHGLKSEFPLSDVAVMGPLNILPKLPRIVRRVHETVAAALAADPDAVVIIDSPEFTHPIAKRIRRRKPDIPIIDYVSPSVWAWRPGRAAKMKPYVDHLLALLPFEPAAHERLGGPPCTYVGHPLTERIDWLRELDPEPLRQRLGMDPKRHAIVVLPGSRGSEVSRLLGVFSETIEHLRTRGHEFDVIIPAVTSQRENIEEHVARWSEPPHIVEGEDDKFRAFKLARCALAASGTVTLELAVSGTPMVVAYRVDAVAARLRFLLKVHSVVLANLVLGENAFPEFLQEECTPELLSEAVAELLADGPTRARQLEALVRVPEIMRLTTKQSPSEKAAQIVLSYARGERSPVSPD